jgi:hypothetical protein
MGADLTAELVGRLRDVVASGLDSQERALDRTHIVVRTIRGQRDQMLADVELEVFCQKFSDRHAERDSRAERISEQACELLGCGVATWIHLVEMGYARVMPDGSRFFSD